jgi:hypothetical protein
VSQDKAVQNHSGTCDMDTVFCFIFGVCRAQEVFGVTWTLLSFHTTGHPQQLPKSNSTPNWWRDYEGTIPSLAQGHRFASPGRHSSVS